jgi:hypothetical protein
MIAAVAVSSLTVGVLMGHSQVDPGCQEDEVYAVQRDTNPAHGLTWACESADGFIERSFTDDCTPTEGCLFAADPEDFKDQGEAAR